MTYCLKCRQNTGDSMISEESVSFTTKTGKRVSRRVRKSICSSCHGKKTQFIKNIEGGKIDIHTIIGKLPKPRGGWTLPNHKYTGPYNPLHEQLDANDNPLPGQEPYNQVDSIAMRHDICYRDHVDDKHGCDKQMLNELDVMQSNGLRERIDRAVVKGVIGT